MAIQDLLNKLQIMPFDPAIISGVLNAQPVALNGDHVQMVKFNSVEDNDYCRVSSYIVTMVGRASVKAKENWKREDAHRSM